MCKRKTQDEGTGTPQLCPPLLTIEQVARILGIGRSSVSR
ncbi:helix-turn-helix domain-containing protein [Tengunoibacter tsumagoiensis]|nr:helix-turn-helix domain-containing protein [Tengunoibacter tsumagoiensis]